MPPFLNRSLRVVLPRFRHLVLWFNAFELRYFEQSLFHDFGVECPTLLTGAVPKRKAEYFAGRLAARRALQFLGCKTLALPIGEHRLPQWPSGYRGSISHTRALAVSAVCHQEHYQAVGIDTEIVFTADQCTRLTSAIVSEAEWNDVIRGGCTLAHPQLVTLIFSAKEALYKALFPHTLLFQNFSAARLTWICEKTAQFQIELTCEWSGGYRTGSHFTGWFRFFDHTVVTVIADGPPPAH
ncbi:MULTISPECIES: 4'-phosphopantetheinyl transferase family protein [Enterobacterales]|uniref:Enterobactin synthase component D n=2 Tax=Enterobacter agglomerans TaxID=549 RepID=Q84FK5_ENTAG|nr:4'-phosphopantetheinyl transferase superfamily protein [Pantoea agglomerans]AAO39112.1 AdmR [Pantoea agglomerans]MBK4724641.1 4'-phosphopantetheinyl transferase superfamily protein [Pantoea agglomerans]MEE4407134.1 4'-phosphopantetheinyl transferase superfamily protein [Enterobacter mori]